MADTLDVLTLPEAKAALRIGATDTTMDDDLVRLITTVSRKLDECVGPVVRRTVTAERHNGGSRSIELGYGPVSSVSTVTEYQGDTAVTLTEQTAGTTPTNGWFGERYQPDRSLYSGIIVRTYGGQAGGWWAGVGSVAVTYTAGRATATSTVDARYKEAGVLMLRNLWRPYENSVGAVDEFDTPMQSFPTFTVPRAVRDMLAEEWQIAVGFGA